MRRKKKFIFFGGKLGNGDFESFAQPSFSQGKLGKEVGAEISDKTATLW